MNYFKNYQNIKIQDADKIKNLLKNNNNIVVEQSELKTEDEKRAFNFISNLNIVLDNISSIKEFNLKQNQKGETIKTIENTLDFEIIKVIIGDKQIRIPTNIQDLNQLVQLFSITFSKSGTPFLRDISRSNDIYWYGYTKSTFKNGQVIIDSTFSGRDANISRKNEINIIKKQELINNQNQSDNNTENNKKQQTNNKRKLEDLSNKKDKGKEKNEEKKENNDRLKIIRKETVLNLGNEEIVFDTDDGYNGNNY